MLLREQHEHPRGDLLVREGLLLVGPQAGIDLLHALPRHAREGEVQPLQPHEERHVHWLEPHAQLGAAHAQLQRLDLVGARRLLHVDLEPALPVTLAPVAELEGCGRHLGDALAHGRDPLAHAMLPPLRRRLGGPRSRRLLGLRLVFRVRIAYAARRRADQWLLPLGRLGGAAAPLAVRLQRRRPVVVDRAEEEVESAHAQRDARGDHA